MAHLGNTKSSLAFTVRLSRLPHGRPEVPNAEFHIRRLARDALDLRDSLFSAKGDVIFVRVRDAIELADALRTRHLVPATEARASRIHAMGLVHEILHGVVSLYRKRAAPALFAQTLETLRRTLGDDLDRTLLAFVEEFPPPSVYQGKETASAFLARATEATPNAELMLEELILLWITTQNPAYAPISSLISDRDLRNTTRYLDLIELTRTCFATAPTFGPRAEPLIEMLLAPSRHSPESIFGQLEFMRAHWGLELAELDVLRRLLMGSDLVEQENAWFERHLRDSTATAHVEAPTFRGDLYEREIERFSPDLDWMPRVVMIAKSTFVWLEQLTRKYGRPIATLADIPDAELATLAARGFTALWLIGVWRRSAASQHIKRIQGKHDALASAYSLHSYEIAPEIGGPHALSHLARRAERHGIRMASDMVPNHMGIDSAWVNQHPSWFIQSDQPPFPGYRFEGPDLGSDPDIGVYLEEGYWARTDAAVVFKRVDRRTGEVRYIYHGNDGTSMPWNDTAQLDYLSREVREAVMQTILHVARQFPIIRFDAAMTLAKRHYQRLWFPLPGATGSIPSRAEHALTKEQFDALYPAEFWREVVDRIAAEVPDTLLLAEAFWLMEGYFVRTLGMHRVYNSAFMNMLKREENANYRLTIRNVLEFNPQILKRFVNFMNNPDEEPAVVQFGKDDKYFGVCVLLATMPGLPMFGHGQIEGFAEKYGMEFARATWHEEPDPWVVGRHEREIFPLLAKRALFSEVDNFLLYDFVTLEGNVDEDVFVYSNRQGDERAIVVYHNKYKETRGSLRESVGYLDPSGALARRTLVEGLALSSGPRAFVIFRDAITGLEHIRKTETLVEQGLTLDLRAFEYHVFWEMREVLDTSERPYAELERALEGRGVPSIETALVDHTFRAIHVPFYEAINIGSARWLADRAEDATEVSRPESVETTTAEKLRHLAEGLRWMIRSGLLPGNPSIEAAEMWSELVEWTAQEISFGTRAARALVSPSRACELGADGIPVRARTMEAESGFVAMHDEITPEHFVVAHAFVRAVGRMEARLHPGRAGAREEAEKAESTAPRASGTAGADRRSEVLSRWHLERVVLRAFKEAGASEAAAERALARMLILLQTTVSPPDSSGLAFFEMLSSVLSTGEAERYLEVHVWEGTAWLRKERFQELLSALVPTMLIAGPGPTSPEAKRIPVAAARALELGEQSGWRFNALVSALRAETKRARE